MELFSQPADKAKCTKMPSELQEGDFFVFLRFLTIFFNLVLPYYAIQGETITMVIHIPDTKQ
jgi:hypothetical protein